MILNLLINALKFTFIGSIEITANESSNNKIRLSIKDTGIGIPYNKQSKIFNLFGSSECSNEKKKVGGAGLGLTISNKVFSNY